MKKRVCGVYSGCVMKKRVCGVYSGCVRYIYASSYHHLHCVMRHTSLQLQFGLWWVDDGGGEE